MPGGRLILPLSEPTLTAQGVPSPGATLTVFLTGTDTFAELFADVNLTTPILNPQTSDSAGRFYAQSTLIWADATQAYDAVLQLPDGEMFQYENLFLLGAAQAVSGFAPINSPTFTGVPQAPTPAANDASAKIATTQFVQAAIANASLTQAGTLSLFALPGIAGAGWLLCDGSAVSRTTFAALFGAIGTTFGAGDGSTTFNLPPALGQFLRVLNTTGTGPDPSRAAGSSQDQQLQGHLHNWGVQQNSGTGGVAANFASGGDNGIFQNQLNTSGHASGTTSDPIADATNGAVNVGAETRPTNIAFPLYIHV
jgi:microcystin-dependent protein